MDYRYVAKGAYEGAALPGGNVPARDLAEDELPEIAARRGQTVKELVAEIEACGLYASHGEGSKASKKPASKAAHKPAAHKAASAAAPKADTPAQATDTEPPAPERPSVLPMQTGPTGEMVTPAPLEPKAP